MCCSDVVHALIVFVLFVSVVCCSFLFCCMCYRLYLLVLLFCVLCSLFLIAVVLFVGVTVCFVLMVFVFVCCVRGCSQLVVFRCFVCCL